MAPYLYGNYHGFALHAELDRKLSGGVVEEASTLALKVICVLC